MKILITGANGQLGKALQKELKEFNDKAELICTDSHNLDITSLEAVKKQLYFNKPDIVINCAAHTQVDLCESDVENAYKINSLGPKHLAQICHQIDAKLVHISTDYVFDGEKSSPQKEDSLTNPTSVYGTSKLLGEKFVQEFCNKYFIIRTAWLYGEGNNFVRTMLKLSETNKELNVVGDQYGSPTSTKDLAHCIARLIETEYYGIYHGTCEGECSWYEFALKIFELSNIDVTVNEVTSDEFVRPAKRPKYSVLENFMLKLYNLNTFRNWEEALKDYLNE